MTGGTSTTGVEVDPHSTFLCKMFYVQTQNPFFPPKITSFSLLFLFLNCAHLDRKTCSYCMFTLNMNILTLFECLKPLNLFSRYFEKWR